MKDELSISLTYTSKLEVIKFILGLENEQIHEEWIEGQGFSVTLMGIKLNDRYFGKKYIGEDPDEVVDEIRGDIRDRYTLSL